MFTLRSNVTQQRRKNLADTYERETSTLHSPEFTAFNEVANALSVANMRRRVAVETDLRSGWGSDNATRMNPGYRRQSCGFE